MKNNLTSVKLIAIIKKIKKLFNKSPKVHFEQSYQGQKILLLALYQNENILF